MRTFPICLFTVLAGAATAAQAKTAVEFTYTLLEYSDTVTKKDSDEINSDEKDTTLATADASFDLGIYADNMSLRLEVGGADEFNVVRVGWAINDKMYAGPLLGIRNNKHVENSKPDGVPKTETKTDSTAMAIGPFIHYRVKDTQQMIEAEAALAQINSKTKTTTQPADTELTIEDKMMALAISGNYRKAIWERVYFGAGLAYAFALSGDSTVDDGNNSTDYDVDYSNLELTLVDMLVEF